MYGGIAAIVFTVLCAYQWNSISSLDPAVMGIENVEMGKQMLAQEAMKYLILTIVLFIVSAYCILQLKKPQHWVMSLEKFLDLYGSKIVWIYKVETTIRVVGIKAGITNSYMIALDNGKQHQAELPSQNGFPEVSDFISKAVGKNITSGYSDELLNKYLKDPKIFS